MVRFSKDEYLKKLRFNKYKRYLYIDIPCLLVLLIGIYFTYSKFNVFKEKEVVRTTVGEFISKDATIGAYIDGEYSKTIPGKNDGYVVDKISCDNDASASWNNDFWGIVLTNLTKKTKCNVYFETKRPSLSEVITTAMSNNHDMFASDDPGKNIRYIGANPDNYVYFNCRDYTNQTADTCELWRIIGILNNVTKEDGSQENLVKIIRNDFIGKYPWDYKMNGVGTSTTDYGSNDWSDSQLMMMLNPTSYLKSGYTNSNDIIYSGNQQLYSKMGSYYNGTKGCQPAAITSGATFSCTEVDFSSTGLKNDVTRNAIESVVWNLGGTSSYTSASNGLVSHFYGYERGTTAYSGHATTWTGKIGLMYSSDYGYATSGGTTKNRNACLAKELYNWSSTYFSDCRENDYLLDTSSIQWEMTPTTAGNRHAFYVNVDGSVNNGYVRNANAIRPTLFLKSNISVKSGDGSFSVPYQLKIS